MDRMCSGLAGKLYDIGDSGQATVLEDLKVVSRFFFSTFAEAERNGLNRIWVGALCCFCCCCLLPTTNLKSISSFVSMLQ